MKSARISMLGGIRPVNRLFPRAPLERASPMEADASCPPHANASSLGCRWCFSDRMLDCLVGVVRQLIHFAGSPSSLGHLRQHGD